MNTVGKIFVMLIFVMSIMFMSFVIAVYMTHTNWKQKVTDPSTGLTKRLNDAQNENRALTDKLALLQQQHDTELQQKQVLLAQAEERRIALQQERDQMDRDLQTLRTAEAGHIAAMNASEKRQEDQRTELTANRADLRQARTDRDANFAEVVKLTEDYHAGQLQLTSLQDRQLTLGQQYANALDVLRKHDLQPEPSLYTGIPPRVEGIVLAVRPSGLIEVSIGSDDGLMKGHALQVYRIADDQSVYLGKVEVTETAPDKVVCKILPDFRKGTIQRGDRVASRLD